MRGSPPARLLRRSSMYRCSGRGCLRAPCLISSRDGRGVRGEERLGDKQECRCAIAATAPRRARRMPLERMERGALRHAFHSFDPVAGAGEASTRQERTGCGVDEPRCRCAFAQLAACFVPVSPRSRAALEQRLVGCETRLDGFAVQLEGDLLFASGMGPERNIRHFESPGGDDKGRWDVSFRPPQPTSITCA